MKVCLYCKQFSVVPYPFDYTAVAVSGNVGAHKTRLTSGVTAVTPTDRPKSVRNRCVIEVFGGVFCIVTMLFGFFYGCMGVCHRTESDLFLFVQKEDVQVSTPRVLQKVL